jgi:hypothetical protein
MSFDEINVGEAPQMTEYGTLFDQDLSTIAFFVVNAAFMATYAVLLGWIALRSRTLDLKMLRAA